MEDRVKTIFDFSLYVMPLLVTLVTYFRSILSELSGSKPLEGSKICCCQH